MNSLLKCANEVWRNEQQGWSHQHSPKGNNKDNKMVESGDRILDQSDGPPREACILRRLIFLCLRQKPISTKPSQKFHSILFCKTLWLDNKKRTFLVCGSAASGFTRFAIEMDVMRDDMELKAGNWSEKEEPVRATLSVRMGIRNRIQDSTPKACAVASSTA